MKICRISIRIRRLIELTLFLAALIILFCFLIQKAVDGGCNTYIALLQIVFALLFMALSWLLISLPGKIVRNEIFIVFFFLLLLILGILAYPTTGSEFKDPQWFVHLLWPFNNTLSVFFPSRGDYAADSAQFGCVYWLFQTLMYVFIAWIGMALFGKKLMNGTSVRLIPPRYRNIIWKYSEGGYELAKDMRLNMYSTSEPVFVLEESIEFDETQEKTIFNKLCSENILVVNTNIESGLKCHIHGQRHFFMTEDQNYNVNMALKVLQQILSHPRFQKMTCHLFVRCEMEGVDALFQDKVSKWCKANGCDSCDFVEIHIFNQSDLTARQFIGNYPTLDLENRPDLIRGGSCLTVNHDTLQVEGEPGILILGFGWIGFEILKKSLCDTRYPGKGKVRITVIDDDFKDCHGAFSGIIEEARKFGADIEINPSFIDKDENCGINKRVHKAGSTRFYRWLAEDRRILSFNRIIVTLGDDALNISTALDIHRFRARFLSAESAADSARMPEKIFAHVKEMSVYDYFDDSISPIIPFGGLSEINTCGILIDEKMDTIAKMVNYVYSRYDVAMVSQEELNKELSTSGSTLHRAWKRASIFNQDSSRAVALNVSNAVRICGGCEKLEQALKDKEKLDCLGEMEHGRWNAFHIMKGITPWPLEEVCALNGKKNGKLYFYDSLFKHICLVTYEDLDKASEKINVLNGKNCEDYKEIDRRIIRHFPIFYKYR